MTAIETIADTDWNSDNVTKPTIIREPNDFRFHYRRCLSFRRVESIEDYMGLFSRAYYTPDSYDAYICYACSSTESDCEAIKDEMRRICSQFSPSGSDKILVWEGGDWEYTTPYRWEFRFVIMKKKSGATIPNAI